jgi:Tol biopolymer transport system component
MDPTGDNPRQLTSGDVSVSYPDVSPDGRYIIYLSAPKGSVDIWRMNIDGSNSLQLTHGDYSFTPACTPDSRWVVYSHVKDGKYNLWKVPIEGGNPVQITDKHSHSVAVSPDGKFVACEYQEDEAGTSHQVAIIPLEGGKPLKTFDRQEYARLLWLPDGHALGVIDSRDGVPNLWTLPLDGSNGQQLTHFKSDRIFTFSWSRDGKSLVVARGPVVSDVILINGFR